jgi:hypothetical protein
MQPPPPHITAEQYPLAMEEMYSMTVSIVLSAHPPHMSQVEFKESIKTRAVAMADAAGVFGHHEVTVDYMFAAMAERYWAMHDHCVGGCFGTCGRSTASGPAGCHRLPQ